MGLFDKKAGEDKKSKSEGPIVTDPPNETEKSPPNDAAANSLKSLVDKNSPQNPDPLEERIAARFGKVQSALGPGTVIKGKLSFEYPVRIDGQLTGEITSTNALIVGPEGKIDAQVKVASLVVMGEVKGSTITSDRIELLRGGTIEGDVITNSFIMEEESCFTGHCDMGAGEKTVTVEKVKESPKVKVNGKASKKAAAEVEIEAEVEDRPSP